MDIEELYELLTEEQKKEVSQLIFNKVKKAIDNIDEKALGETYMKCLSEYCDFIYDIDYGDIQDFLSDKMFQIVKKALEGEKTK